MLEREMSSSMRLHSHYLLLIAGLGGLLYGIDVGIIAGALPYLESTASAAWKLDAQQISFVVAAVLLGSVLSSLFAGALADLVGRKPVMIASGALFVASIPVIALADGYTPLLLGRLLQGVSGGLIGVVVPLYLAECLGAHNRGKGTGIFQLLLTIGLVVAALIGLYHARNVDSATAAASLMKDEAARVAHVFAAKDRAWRQIFWMSITPGLAFSLGSIWLSESPRWLVRRGRNKEALAALQKTRSAEDAQRELHEMQAASVATSPEAKGHNERLLQRKYVFPFVLACVILACNQATGINSILAYVVNILNQGGLPGSIANWGDVLIKIINAAMTVAAVALVDRKGRKFLLMLGSGGIVVSLALTGMMFLSAENQRVDVTSTVALGAKQDSFSFTFDAAAAAQMPVGDSHQHALQLTVVSAYGPFSDVQTRRSNDLAVLPINVTREQVVRPDSVIGAFFRKLRLNPFADPALGLQAPLHIQKVLVGPVPSTTQGWLVAACIFSFVAFFAIGPGVCVWLALSELMPTRIRSNGMSVALLVNQFVSTVIAAVFLPTVGKFGYAAMFFFWAGATVIYFLTAAFVLPETKGKTLEEIEAHFQGRQTKPKAT
jgi:MFS transporter, SP family, solute carrier family 2 (myo-inositol transporter), member 13